MEVINPQLKELERKHEDLRNTVSQMQGELDELRRTARDTSRQTIWQFVIFTVTMATVMLGGIKYATDSIHREMDVRFTSMEQHIDQAEKNINARFEDLKQEVRASRK